MISFEKFLFNAALLSAVLSAALTTNDHLPMPFTLNNFPAVVQALINDVLVSDEDVCLLVMSDHILIILTDLHSHKLRLNMQGYRYHRPASAHIP